MAIELTLSHDGPLEFYPGLPSDYSGPILRGANAFSTKTNLAELVFQELTGENYSIRFIIGRFLKRLYASGWIHTHGLYSYFMLKNGTRKQLFSKPTRVCWTLRYGLQINEPGEYSEERLCNSVS